MLFRCRVCIWFYFLLKNKSDKVYFSLVNMSRMNINTASVEQLCGIKGIGPKQAKAIIYHREMYGPMTKWLFP